MSKLARVCKAEHVLRINEIIRRLNDWKNQELTDKQSEILADIEVSFATIGMEPMSKDELDRLIRALP